jgi:hypothetical protein
MIVIAPVVDDDLSFLYFELSERSSSTGEAGKSGPRHLRHLPRYVVFLPGRSILDQRSLNIDTFEQIYVLMGHALPEEAPACPVQ